MEAKRLRGRRGIWTPGGELPPIVDLGYQRISEETECVNLIKRIKVEPPQRRDLLLRLFHIANGGSRGAREAALFKAQGVRPGVPDYHLPIARDGYHGLYLEMKAAHGTLSTEQKDELARLAADGYVAICAWSAESAFDSLTKYLGS